MMAPSLLLLLPAGFLTGFPAGFVKERTPAYSAVRWLVQLAPLALFALFPARQALLTAASYLIGRIVGGSLVGVGLTGGIATGKSSVSQCFLKAGAVIIDADQVARKVVIPGQPAYKAIVRAFGDDVVNEQDGTLDRAKLGAIIFKDPSKRKILNSCTHKFILWEMFKDLVFYRLIQRRRLVILDAPLLFETHFLEHFCFPKIVVACSEKQEMERLMKRDSITKEQAEQRISSQMKLHLKVEKADLVIANDGLLEDLTKNAHDTLLFYLLPRNLKALGLWMMTTEEAQWSDGDSALHDESFDDSVDGHSTRMSHDPTTPVQPGKRKRGPVVTPGTIVDEAELARRRRRRQSLAFQQRRKSLTPSKGKNGPGSGTNRQYISDMYSTIIKMSSENKINVKNSWSLHLIDHMQDILRDGTSAAGEAPVEEASNTYNFQKASCTLDARIKIYSYRVDDTWSSSYKILENLSRGANAKRGKIAEDGEELDGEGGDDDDDNEKIGSAPARKARKPHTVNTIEKNLKNINMKSLDLEVESDPMFHKMAKAFDEGGARGLLLANLSVYDGCKILLDSNQANAMTRLPIKRDGESVEGEERTDSTLAMEKVDLSSLGDLEAFSDALGSLRMCPRLDEIYAEVEEFRRDPLHSDFIIDADGELPMIVEEDQDDEEGEDRRQGDDAAVDFESAPMDMEVDEEPDCDMDVDMEYVGVDDGADQDGSPVDDIAEAHDQGGADDDPEPRQDATADERDDSTKRQSLNPPSLTATEYFASKEAANKEREKYTLVLESALLRAAAADDSAASDYSYFDLKLLKNWAGPAHWKIPGVRRATPAANRTKASQQTINEEADLQSDDEEGGTKKPTRRVKRADTRDTGSAVIDFFAIDEPDLKTTMRKPRTEAAITMSKLVLKRQAEKASDLVLPVDARIDIQLFFQHFAKPRLRFFQSSNPRSSLGGAASHDKRRSFGGDFAAKSELSGDEGPVFDDHDVEDDLAADTASFAFETSADDSNQLYSGSELLQADRVVQSVDVHYERVAKRVDVKNLKTTIWEHLETPIASQRSLLGDDDASQGDEEAVEELTQEFDRRASLTLPPTQTLLSQDNGTTFENVLHGVADKVPSNVTMPFYFICMLHLANEKGLELVGQEDLSDFEIRLGS
ncbi:TPA: hypothetical protein N0F65_012336 [Lagenidium giganteum]|uniref:Condensin complex subunit 2 n=1 Tax=Lagenidium giganteum TaxID=4803 RepID=A0AAV2YTR9_9STRA|nr:TPA: hypothetical protein N0F65_012336 [Lagenidium giganteum]